MGPAGSVVLQEMVMAREARKVREMDIRTEAETVG